jgi:hypothetical protein
LRLGFFVVGSVTCCMAGQAMEMERFDALSEEMEKMRQRCEALLDQQSSEHERDSRDVRMDSSKREQGLADKIRQLHDDLKYNEVKFEEVLRQQESEYERELVQLKAAAERELELERQNTALKEQELSSKKNKLEQLKKKMQGV